MSGTDFSHPLKVFERFLEIGPIKKSLSRGYQMLLSQVKVTDWTRRAWEIDLDSEITGDQWTLIRLAYWVFPLMLH